MLFPVGKEQYLVCENDKYFTRLDSKVFTEVHRNIILMYIRVDIKWENVCKLQTILKLWFILSLWSRDDLGPSKNGSILHNK